MFSRVVVAVAVVLMVSTACSGGDNEAAKATAVLGSRIEEAPAAAAVTREHGARPNPPTLAPVEGATAGAPSSTNQESDDFESLTRPEGPGQQPAITVDGDAVNIHWDALTTTPYFAPADDGDDPFFHIHTHPDTDGFFLSFEMFTVWGGGWSGELGTVDISCLNPDTGSGICAYFDADGVGPDPILGDDFAATGSMTINQLDADGYDIVVHALTFSDGTTFEEFSLTG